MAIAYRCGTILLISNVLDKNNVNHKKRPVVLIRDFDDDDPLLFGVAVTGTFDYPLPETSIRLPYHRQGRCRTGLTKDGVADCDWIVTASADDIVKAIGIAPAIQLDAILEQVEKRLPP